MEFQLMNAGLYNGYSDKKDVDEILARLYATNFKDRIRIDSGTFLGWEVKNIYIEIRTMEELIELYNMFDSELIIGFGEEYPHIVIYDDCIEY